MRIDILTVVPELLDSPLSHSIVGRARKNGLVEIYVHNIRKYGLGPRLSVDDYSYGGDAGMVMMIEPVEKMIEEGNQKAAVVYEAMAYQVAKSIAAMTIPLKGKVDAIILTGGAAHSKKLTGMIQHHHPTEIRFIV